MAIPEETEKYFKRLAHQDLPDHAIRVLGRSNFQVSSIGFGGYRVHHNSVEHARSLRYALLNGFNLIDTSSNYTDGGSEMLIGNMLQEMTDRKELHREEVVIVSKVGYVQGQNLRLVQENERLGRPFPEVVKYMEGCWHCIHPDFLQDQLSRSLERLQVPSLDVYLLHNPEYFLSHAKKQNEMDVSSARDEYYRRIRMAFEWLEEKVAEGKIKAYGISSNTFPAPADDFEFTSLERIAEIAGYVASNNYFQVIQFPFNLFETGACFEKNQAHGKTLLDLAAENKIATLANRPLNAMTPSGMVRLASFRESNPKEVQNAFEKSLKRLANLEDQLQSQLLDEIPPDLSKANVQQVFSVAKQLPQALQTFQGWQHWDHVKQNIILPQSASYLDYLSHKLRDNPSWQTWASAYTDALHDFLDAVTRHYENAAAKRSGEIEDRLNTLDVTMEFSDTLSQKTLRTLISTPGIDCVLLGMRRVPYVEDALAAVKQAPVSNPTVVLAKLNQQGADV